jgi:pSer/pThr/pTyr-binding forkhead associated (FHA) protein
MLCVNCGKANADNFRFCQFCGTPMKADAHKSHSDLSPESLPESTVTSPISLDDWLIDSSIEDASLNSPAISESDFSLSDISMQVSVSDVNQETKVPADMHSRDFSDGMPRPACVPASYARYEERICQKCGVAIADGHRFCGNCGSRFESKVALEAVSRESDSVGSKRAVERVNFVHRRVQSGPEYARFMLYHINDDGSMGESIPLYEGENIIGRTSSSLLSTDRFVNPKHVRIICDQNYAIVEDCDSLNGVYLRISDESLTLLDGDIFRIGEEVMSYHEGNSNQPILKSRTSEHTMLIGGDERPGWGYLRLIVGAFSEGNVYRLWQPSISIGRTHADILFPKDGFVSGTHATLSYDGDSVQLTDLNSSNGTFVRLKAPLRLDDATYFLIGNQLLCIEPR